MHIIRILLRSGVSRYITIIQNYFICIGLIKLYDSRGPSKAALKGLGKYAHISALNDNISKAQHYSQKRVHLYRELPHVYKQIHFKYDNKWIVVL